MPNDTSYFVLSHNPQELRLLFNNEFYQLADNQHTTGTLVFSHVGYEASQLIVKTITITISTRAWVLTTIYPEDSSNKKTSITGEGNDTDYPTTNAVVDYVAVNKAYHITINSTTGSILPTEYDSLKNDKSSYVIFDISEGSFEIYCFKGIDSNNSLFYECVLGSTTKSLGIDEHGNYNIKTSYYEMTSRKVTSLSSSSTDIQYPSAKAAYDSDQSTLTAAKSYADTAIATAITTTLNTPV